MPETMPLHDRNRVDLLLLGRVAVVPEEFAARRIDCPLDLTDAWGRIPAADALRFGARLRRTTAPRTRTDPRAKRRLVIVTDRDLAHPGCRCLFGLSGR